MAVDVAVPLAEDDEVEVPVEDPDDVEDAVFVGEWLRDPEGQDVSVGAGD